jgi:tetratricopeptide (TPR) repeat protein
VHVTTGLAVLAEGDYRGDPEHPPFLRAWAALPLMAMTGVALDTSTIERQPVGGWVLEGLFAFAHRTLYLENDADRLLYAARFMIVLLGVVLGVLLFCWTYEWLGLPPALFALAVYTVEPNLAAHAAVVTTDFGLACFLFGTCYFLWRTCRQASRANIAGLAVFFVLAIVSKYSAVVLGPIVLLLLAVAVGKRTISVRLAGGLVALLFVASFVGLWAVYGFHYTPSASGTWLFQVQDVTLSDGQTVRQRVPLLTDIVEWVDANRLLPNAYSQGFLISQAKAQVRAGYLMGEYGTTGWASYFPIAFLVKTPVGLLALLAAGLVALAARWRHLGWDTAAFVAAPALVYFGVAMTSSLNIGLRHVLPVYPFAIVIAAAAVWWVVGGAEGGRAVGVAEGWSAGRRSRLSVPAGAALLLAFEFGAVYPHNLAFFNVLAGGPDAGARYLADSNIDWGQGLKGLKRWMDDNAVDRVNLAYFGAADPAYYGMNVTYLPGAPFFASNRITRPQVPGYVAIGETVLSGATVEEGWRLFYRPFTTMEPVARIGHAMRVFQVDRWPIAEVASNGSATGGRDVEVAGALALMLGNLGWFDEAIGYYRQYLSQKPDDVTALGNLGIALLATGNAEEAVRTFRRAVETNGSDGPARRNLANALFDLGQVEEAAVHAVRAVELRPDDAGALTLLGRVRALQGRFPEAAAAFERAVQLAPADAEARGYLQKLQALAGR